MAKDNGKVIKTILGSDITTCITVLFKRATGAKAKEYPEAKGINVSLNLEAQSALIRDIVMGDEGLITRYGERELIDARNCILQDGLQVKLCKYLDEEMKVMVGVGGFAGGEIICRNKADGLALQEKGTSWKYDSGVVRTRIVDTRTIGEKLADAALVDASPEAIESAQIMLIERTFKVDAEKAKLMLPILTAS